MMEKLELLCLPYAGSSAIVYGSWKNQLHSDIALRMVEFSGRGRRYEEPLLDSVAGMVDDLYVQLQLEQQDRPYAFFGHSLGAILAYELVQRLIDENKRLPEHIFLSGQTAPHKKEQYRIDHELDDPSFIKEILKLGGTSSEVFENMELSKLFLPVIRNDIKAANTYQYVERNKINVQVSVLFGDNDPLSNDFSDYGEWNIHTSAKCNLLEFKGGHFFIHDHKEQVIRYVNETLAGK